MSSNRYPRIASLKSIQAFQTHLKTLGINIPFEEDLESTGTSPLAQPVTWGSNTIGNRWCILPMEGWDGTTDGKPSELTRRRWRNFGASGAKLIWGCEAVAVCHEGRANPNQLWIRKENQESLASIRQELVDEHRLRFGTEAGLLVGLQLTHSGRFSRPNLKDRMEPKIVYHHPILDRRLGIPATSPVLSDSDITRIIDLFVDAARLAWACGYAFVDIKHCHGYLGHEFLSAVERPGPFGGSFENRTRFLREIVRGIRSEVPRMEVVVRLSAFDFVPYTRMENGRGAPELFGDQYAYGFGCDPVEPTRYDLTETEMFLDLLEALEIRLVCISAGSPYYNPHIQRPALFPASDAYDPPEDPLIGVARQVSATAQLKKKHPRLLFVGSGYSYLQEFLPGVAQAVVRAGWTDFVGLGRMVLAYPDLPADVLGGHSLKGFRLCRTFSDCTTGPRHGFVSGCYPLDPFYKSRPEALKLKTIKEKLRKRGS